MNFAEAIPSLRLADSSLSTSSLNAYLPLTTDSTVRLLNIKPAADFREPLVYSFEEVISNLPRDALVSLLCHTAGAKMTPFAESYYRHSSPFFDVTYGLPYESSK